MPLPDAWSGRPRAHDRTGARGRGLPATEETTTPQNLAVLFLLQLACILTACRLIQRVTARAHQPPVVGEMIAGVALGPSLFGLVAPATHAALFPPASLPILDAGGQLGLVVYMFLVGAGLQHELVRQHRRAAVAVSVTGIVVPFALGAVLALALVPGERFFTASVSTWQAMVYLGAAMSITAFPMLARIIADRGLGGSALGAVALTAGAANDAAAWCVLAVVLSSLHGDLARAVYTLAGAVLFVAVAHQALRPWLARLSSEPDAGASLVRDTLGPLLIAVFAAAWVAHGIGLHAVFGAFVVGLAVPRGPLVRALESRLEPLTTSVLLPLFFVNTGLQTRIGLLDTPALWATVALVVGVASLGKGVACGLAARLTGHDTRTAAGIGVLMNARGLIELIILNIGLQLNVITPTLFTVMVLMAVVTTLCVGPLFAWIHRPENDTAGAPPMPQWDDAAAGGGNGRRLRRPALVRCSNSRALRD